MRIIQGLLAEPFREFHFQLVPLIPYSEITITILTIIFHIFTHVENQPLKQQLKHKRPIILKNLQNVFSVAIETLFNENYISCKINLISDNKLCKDDMKIIQLFRRFQVQTLHKLMPRNFLTGIIIYFYKTKNNPIA